MAGKWQFSDCCWHANCFRSPVAIVDNKGNTFALLAGQPGGNYSTKCKKAASDIEKARHKIRPNGLTKKDMEKRRGNFLAETFGFSHGGGRKVNI
jgi:hypothetical protein